MGPDPGVKGKGFSPAIGVTTVENSTFRGIPMKKLLSLMLLLMVSLPVSAQLLTTCYDINTGLVPEYTFVRVEALIVTAVADYGYYAQEQAGGDGDAGT